MKLALLSSVPLRTLLVFGAILGITRALTGEEPEDIWNITVTDITTSSISLTWIESKGNSSFYRVQWTDGNVSHSNNVTTTSITMTNLTAGVQYEITVTAVTNEGRTEGQNTSVSQYTKPEVVRNITVTEITTSSISLKWIKPNGNSSFYRVQWTDGNVSHSNNVTTTSITMTNLTAGVQYEITVTAVTNEGRTEGQNTSVSQYTKPEVVRNITVTDITTSSISLTWIEPKGNSSFYRVQWTDGNVSHSNNVTTTSITMTNLTAGVQYEITVTAVTNEGRTEGQNTSVSQYTRPVKPESIMVTARGANYLNISWTLRDGRVDHYLVTISDERLMYSNQTEATTFSFTDLNPGREFSIKVAAVAGFLNITSNSSVFATVPTPPGALKISQGTNFLDLKWTTPALMEGAPLISYCITYQPEGDKVQNKSSLSNATQLTSLSSGTSHNITVETVGPQNLRSTPIRGSAFTLPNPVQNLSASPTSTTSITVKWLAPQEAKSYYRYLVQINNATGLLFNTTVTNTSTEVTNLQPGTKYNIRVTTIVGEGIQSTVESTFNYTKPAAVSGVMTKGSTTTMTVSWITAEGQVDSYAVSLFRDDHVVNNATGLSNSTTNKEFQNLTAGVLYCVEVVSKSGPFTNTASRVCNATFPNPPGPITMESQTVNSINFTWSFPEGMDQNQCNFSVNNSSLTRNNWYVLKHLESGSPYVLSVVTVCLYQSTAVTTSNYTRPYNVSMLRQTEITTNAVTLEWEQLENKSDYSYLVKTTNGSSYQSETVFNKHKKMVTGLLSGSNYSFTVITQTLDGTQAAPVTVFYFTRPYSTGRLQSEAVNTTAVRLAWDKPAEYKAEYTYRVETTGCGSQNQTLPGNVVDISTLTPGTNCTFCVFVRAANGIEGEARCTSQYTEPEAVQPRLSSNGSNSSMLVSWGTPPGRVERYKVELNSTSKVEQMLNSTQTEYQFNNLSAGRLYSVVVITLSGPFNASSDFITNATFPNPPGTINVFNKITGSFDIGWTEAPLMTGATFYYLLTNRSAHGEDDHKTTNTNHSFTGLLSGTSYNISVATVGAMDFKSATVQIMVTTRPFSVKGLTTSTEEENITVKWENPVEYKENYSYKLGWHSSNEPNLNVTTTGNVYKITNLVPGKQYNTSVTTMTSDGTQSAPIWISSCTNASPVKELECIGPNTAIAQVTLSWKKNKGQMSGFKVTVNNGEIVNSTTSCCNYTVSNLRHKTTYNLSLETQSCGLPSSPVSQTCSTGITNPPIPEDYKALVSVTNKEYNRFSIQINKRLLNNTNGPIQNIGVLVTDQLPGDKDFTNYVGKTYQEWKAKVTPVYMATVKTVTENSFSSRSEEEHLDIEIGDKSKWEGYINGALEATGKYHYAIVLFTSLTLEKSLVNGQLLTSTSFYGAVVLPQDPALISIAVGATLGIFCILFIILIGFIIYWKRLSNKDSPDIQIYSMRAKVSMAVRVEDFEAYYKKQKADSSCGFAEEFEGLKLVGTAQSKIQAETLENKPRNRYNNVLPYDSSRVKLSIIHGSPYEDYINANYMPGYNSRKEYIAAQGPLPATVSEFWRMIWEKNVQTLVMLTRCNEQGRVKCEQYWDHGTKYFDNITVTTSSEIKLDDWTIRDFDVKNVKTAETRSVRHFHFTAWPDHGVPETTELLISFRHLVREHMDQYSRNSPTVVHCSAGVGRTGTFITIDRLIFQIEREDFVDVYGIVHDLRMHRTLMVQTEDQYVFLNQCALDIIRSRTGNNVDLIYQNSAAMSIYENIDPKTGYLCE